ncbi:DHA2 family efflux MFS transporter permease subunit [Gordonia sp. VNK21]|uniref:DHA2 family efflux MFS transporter permease subunit n=1 Tax=Gordonia sp. VNK21 TaxID=3382483 RepID=UPI0038D43659
MLRASEKASPEARRVVWAVIAGLLGPLMDTTMLNIAVDDLGRDLQAGVGAVQWVVTAYLLAFSLTVPICGWAARRWGSRRVWLAGLAVFLLGSVLCAAAWNVGSLIAFRAVQGIGAGLLFPLMTSILIAASRGRAAGQLVAMVATPTALAPIVGPIVGGLLLHWLDWRWLFLVNIPLVLVAIWLARRIPDDRDTGDRAGARLDVVGLLLAAPGLAGVLLALTYAEYGLTRPACYVPLIAGLTLLVAFAVRGMRGPGTRVLVDVQVLRRRTVAASSAGLFFFSVGTFAALLVLPLYFQQLRGQSVLAAALLLIPQGIGTFATRGAAGRLTDSIGPRWVAVAGFVAVALTTVPFAFAGPSTNLVWLSVMLLLRGMGLGMLLSPLMAAGFYDLPMDQRHDVSIVTRTFQQLGGSFGTAVMAAVLASAATSESGFHTAFALAAVLAAVGALLALRLPAHATASG